MRVFSKKAALVGVGLMALSLSAFSVAQDQAPADGQGNQDMRQRMRERMAQQRDQQGGQQQADAPGAPGGQGGQGGQRGQRGQRGQGGMRNFDPASMWENFMANSFKEDLKCTDEEWAKVEPPLKKVVLGDMELRQTENSGMLRGMMGRRGMGGPGGPGGPGGQQAGPGGPGGPGNPFGGEQLKEEQDLQTLLDQPNPAPAEIEAKIKALRDARAKQKAENAAKAEQMKKDLAVSKEALAKVVTPAQLGALVLRGTLD